jgi:hypothetical protein
VKHEIELGDALEEKLRRLFDLVNEASARGVQSCGEPITPCGSLEELIVDLADDTVDDWIDCYSKACFEHQAGEALREGMEPEAT